MNVGELKAKLADLDDSLTVQVDVADVKLGDLNMKFGRLDVSNAKVGPAMGFGQVALIEV